MTETFLIVAVLMVLAALAFVLLPLMRSGRRAGRPRGVFAMALGIAFVLPLAALWLYRTVGTPAALRPHALEPQVQQPKMTLDQAIAQLRERLAKHPDDLKGWLLLGQTYDSLQRPADAREAYGHALELAPDDADVMVAWAEADSMARADHRIQGRALDLLRKAVAKAPRNQRGLWLLGIAQFQSDHFADASLIWRRLKVLLQPGSQVAQAVSRQIAMADARANGKSETEALAMLRRQAPASASSTVAAAADREGVHLQVRVTLDPALAAKVKPGDTLFVFARAKKGPPMPLAVARLKASALPATVMLTDGMGMTPAMRLSSVRQVTVTARVSRSGQALPAPGDLEGHAGPVDVQSGAPVDVVIDRVD